MTDQCAAASGGDREACGHVNGLIGKCLFQGVDRLIKLIYHHVDRRQINQGIGIQLCTPGFGFLQSSRRGCPFALMGIGQGEKRKHLYITGFGIVSRAFGLQLGELLVFRKFS